MIVSYKWLQSYFNEKLPDIGEIVKELNQKSFEMEGVEKIGDDYAIKLDVLPNRAHDCLCHRGIAKEISAIFNIEYKESEEIKILNKKKPTLEVEIKNKEKCKRYIGRVISNVKVGESPEWLKQNLSSIGQKSINNIVDATNFLMFDMGQPLHVFDTDKIKGPRIIIRDAKNDEKMITLNSNEVSLNDNDLVITDGDNILAIAGIKGGKVAEVDINTKNIILESANFNPLSVRKTARKLGILTDSSKRFENEITPEIALEAIERLTDMILRFAGDVHTEVEEVIDQYIEKPSEKRVEVNLQNINETLGSKITAAEVETIFKRLKLSYSKDGETFVVTSPIERFDINIPEDLVEEVGRIYGYDKLFASLPEIKKTPEQNKEYYSFKKIKDILTKSGFSEVYTYSLTKNGEVETMNPLSEDKRFLRTSLIGGLENSIAHNVRYRALLGLKDIKIFELGKVFTKSNESNSLAIAINLNGGKANGNKTSDELEKIIKKIFQEFGCEVEYKIEEHVLELNLDHLIAKSSATIQPTILVADNFIRDIKYRSISAFPFILRDIAVYIPENEYNLELQEIIVSIGGDLIKKISLFDIYKKEIDGARMVSYAYGLVFQSDHKTLTDIEVNIIMDNISKKIKEKSNWEIR